MEYWYHKIYASLHFKWYEVVKAIEVSRIDYSAFCQSFFFALQASLIYFSKRPGVAEAKAVQAERARDKGVQRHSDFFYRDIAEDLTTYFFAIFSSHKI